MNYCSNKLYLELNIFNHFTVVGHWTSIVKFGQLYQQVEVFIYKDLGGRNILDFPRAACT